MRVCLVVLALLVAGSSAHAEKRYAVLIGSNPGWSSDRPLRYAENDAEKLRDVLVALGNFDNDRVVLLRDPDTSEVRATLRDLANTAKGSSEETLVFFYYSGHADDTQMHMRGDPFTFKELAQTLRAMPATIKLGVIDACKSGAVTRKGGSRVDEFVVDVDSPKLSGMVMLTSSGADELSQESRSLQGSVFTHHLVSALRGAGDEDGDNQVTVSEAYHYAYARTRADTAVAGVAQKPAFRYELSGQGELVLAQLKSSKTARVTVPKGDAKYVVLDKNEYRLVAEARADKGRAVELTLAPGTYKVKKVLDDRIEVGQLVLAAGEKAAVDNITYKSTPLSSGIMKGTMDDLSPEEQHEFKRTQAFGILAGGQAQAALEMFDALLRAKSDDTIAWRGRARALVRIAEAYERVGDHLRERLALNDAIKADPGLTEDPMFVVWYKRLGELDARAQVTFEARQKLDDDNKSNPRRIKRWGIGFDLVSGRGVLAVTGTIVIANIVMPRIAVDPLGPGLDGGILIAPYPGRWSPYIGVGAHISLAKLGLIEEKPDPVDPMTGMKPVYDHAEVYGRQIHGEIGAQFVSRAGFTTELGLALMGFETYEGTRASQVYPVMHFGWLW